MKNLLFVFCIFFIANTYSQKTSLNNEENTESNSSIGEFVGDWVGTGWGWEIRFKQSAGEFGKQFARGKLDLPFENEKVIMSLMVTHTTHFYLKIDKTGNYA